MTNGSHPLQSIFDPQWTPSVDIELLALRDQEVAIDRIAQALMRDPKAVEQRWHRLRIEPNIRANLREFGADAREYPQLNMADSGVLTGVSAP